MSIQAEIGLRKEKVEGKHTEQRGKNAIEAALCPGGGEKHPQNIDGDNIGLSEAQTGNSSPRRVAAAKMPSIFPVSFQEKESSEGAIFHLGR